MPRISAESRSAAAFRAGAAPPEPPKHLSKYAAAEWRRIVASKPADWFDAGAQVLLESLCTVTVHERRIAKKLEGLAKADAWDEMKPFEKRLKAMVEAKATLCTKLRLSVQSVVDRHSRKLGERGQPAQPGKQPDTLLGGEAVWGNSAKPN